MQIRNPRTGQEDYTLQLDDAIDINQKARRLRKKQKAWLAAGLDHRIEVINRWIVEIKKYESEIVQQLSIDTGRLQVSQLEVDSILGLLKGWSLRAPQLMADPGSRPSANNAQINITQQLVPYPVVGVISPWNFPLLLAMIDTIPALLAGASVLLKPSEITPRFMDPLELSIKAVPELDAVLKLARGGAEVGKLVVQEVDAICFTGSVNTGQSIAQVCAQRMIPAFLELGGKDAAIVLKDADLETATDAILRGAVGVSGQACQSLERIFVATEIFEAFTDKIIEKAKAVQLNAEAIAEGHIGPIIFAGQAQKIQDHIDDAIFKGAIVHCGGQVEVTGGGYWCRPTVMTGVHLGMKVLTEETFGPILPILPFHAEEQAIQMANDSIYGLSASVFSSDLNKAHEVAAQLDAGAISINDASLTNQVFDAEKNSFKQSGINGSRMGDAGFLRFFRKKAILTQTAQPEKLF